MISLGKIVKVRGNKGEVVFIPSPGRDISILRKGEVVLLESSKYRKSYRVEYSKETSGIYVLKFVNINSINEALRLVGYTIFISSASKESIKRGGIVGFIVKDINGQSWGEIVNIETGSLNKILEVRDQNDVYYVPFNDVIVKEIDEEEGIVFIDPPEGLRDLNK